MGRPLPGVVTRIVDGELQVEPETLPTFFSHYLGAEPFDGEWWPTGDQVREDEDGYLWFEGRDDDIILSAGYRIGPFEVESGARLPPGGRRGRGGRGPGRGAGLGGSRDRRAARRRALRRARPRAPGARQAVTAPYKYPRIVEFADELPKTSSGKIKRAELRSGR